MQYMYTYDNSAVLCTHSIDPFLSFMLMYGIIYKPAKEKKVKLKVIRCHQ